MPTNKKLLAVIVCISILSGMLVGFSISHVQKGIKGVNEENNEGVNEENNTFYVSRIIDGDTIELMNGERVRLIGINAPEKAQPYTVEATTKLSQLIGYNSITLEKDVSDKDQYNRLLRYVYVGSTFVNLEMVKQGYAIAYPYPPEPPTPKEEKEMSFDELRSSLAQRFAWATEALKALREEMKAIEERIKELETPKESKLPTGQAKKTKKQYAK